TPSTAGGKNRRTLEAARCGDGGAGLRTGAKRVKLGVETAEAAAKADERPLFPKGIRHGTVAAGVGETDGSGAQRRAEINGSGSPGEGGNYGRIEPHA